MKTRRSCLLTALLLAAACGGDPAAPDAQVTEVRITPEGASTDVGLTVQFTAQAFDAAGQVVSGLPVTWQSSTQSVATITDQGVATALAVGTTAIQATIGTRSQSQVLTVQPSQCTNRVDVILSPGEFQAYDGDQCLLLPSGSAGDRYRVALGRPTQIADSLDIPDVTLRLNPILTAAAAPIAVPPQRAPFAAAPASIDRLGGIDGTQLMQDMETMRRTREYHYELREREQRLQLATLPSLPNLASLAPPLPVDPPSRLEMHLDLDCSTSNLKPVTLIDFNDDIAFYQDSVEWSATPLSTAATGQMLSYYSMYARDMIADYYGTPSDTDGNQRIIVVTSTSLPSGAAAAVYSGDFVPTASCSGSNEGEVVYFSRDVVDNIVDPSPSYLALSVLAHEVKHVVSIYNGVQRNGFHPSWMEEGRAEIAQTMSSRIAWAATGGPAVNAEIGGQAIIDAVRANGDDITPEMWGVVGQVADLIVNIGSQPNSLVTNPRGASQFHTYYAASFHWHRFIGDEYGNAASAPFADASLFTTLAAQGSQAGAAGLATVTGRSFAQLFEEVIVAASTHKAVASTPAPGFSTWDFASSSQIFTAPPEVAPLGRYPFPITTDLQGNLARGFVTGVYSCPPEWVGPDDSGSWRLPDGSARCPMGPSGIRFHDFRSGGVGVGAQVQVEGIGSSGLIVVTRLN